SAARPWSVLNDAKSGKALPIAPLVELARRHRLLPEGYLYGVARQYRESRSRDAYLMGKYSTDGWREYFPLVFALKTPLATLLLIAGGMVALWRQRQRAADRVLAVGLAVFVVAFGLFAIPSQLDTGRRHSRPICPPLFVLAGASASWLSRRSGQIFVGACCLWLLLANLHVFPQYLSYFNELVGGPRRGYLYLADSNVDWGQDLRRLGRYHRQHPEEH